MPERHPSGEMETFSNPLPPPMEEGGEEDEPHPMTNEDFRKLLMTPREPSSASQSAATSTRAPPVRQTSTKSQEDEDQEPDEDDDDPGARRRKKKSYYAKLKKIEEEREKELAEKYRDRAQERREGVNRDYAETEIISTTADYRAVAPDVKAGENYAERRKQVIQESKYLGGDMEHTHLVKGLDYALLEKVRAEISSKEQVDEEEMEIVVKDKKEEKEDPEDQIQFRTKMARNIFRMAFKRSIPERNELFLPRRMAYVVDLEDDFADSDIPTTLIRSKADCPSLEATTTLTTNDIVINKLTQILSYLRQGRRDQKKLKKKDKAKVKEEDRPKVADEGIYGDIDDYAPGSYSNRNKDKDSARKDRDRRDRDRDQDRDRDRRDRDRDRDRDRRDRDRRDRDRDRDRRDRDRDRERGRETRKSYFEKPADEDEEKDKPLPGAKELVKSINEKFAKGWAPADIEREANLRAGPSDAAAATEPRKNPKEDERLKKIKSRMEIDSYAECYPGMMESADAIDDSDDEVDYTKMDQGNKKGPIGRWDFDTQEEYSDYMANKEALPKAAFQYGVKMADGRKTRRTGPKDEKKELDREWQKIQNIIAKRKQMGTGGEPYSKVAKY